MKPVVIFGQGPIAEVADYYFRKDLRREVAAFTVDGDYLKEASFAGRPTVAFEAVEHDFPAADHDLFVAVSYAQINNLRQRKILEAEAKGYLLASYVSSRAYVWDGFVVQPNVFILEDNTLQPFCVVGRGTTLWSGNHIGHHATVGEYCFIASHVVLSGHVVVGEGSFIGVNATLRDNIRVGKRCVIGAGALLLKDAPDDSVYPATATEMAKIPSSRLRSI